MTISIRGIQNKITDCVREIIFKREKMVESESRALDKLKSKLTASNISNIYLE